MATLQTVIPRFIPQKEFVHPRLEKYQAVAPYGCDVAYNIPDGQCTCDKYISCGPYTSSCLYMGGSAIPCRGCLFWSGYACKDWELNNIITMLEVMINR